MITDHPRRWAVVATVVVVLGASTAMWLTSRSTPSEACPSTSLKDLRTLASKADIVVEGTVSRRVDLSDDEQRASGIEVQVGQTVFGTKATPKVTVWQPLDAPAIKEGKFVFFLATHPKTLHAGKAVNGYDTPASGAIFAVDGPSLRRVCRDSLGPAFDRDTLEAVIG